MKYCLSLRTANIQNVFNKAPYLFFYKKFIWNRLKKVEATYGTNKNDTTPISENVRLKTVHKPSIKYP